ncbi:alpha/beta fold hydrolase [Streptomyces jumonjinensis]|uniref:Alpha/beta fold hydrolase n=1 Tax=Streptomyces jumonjinensis TaxID=1945 RepID=A0A646KNZ5_STRJU|nr:alpha/beta fold hydrolase [Streptomyces jumonjinensis]MQT03788.1 alpha/beta fold hydrolase [Streptomyces jumonjinensis]
MPPSPTLHHRLSGPADAPLLVLGPSLGTSMAVWEQQLPALARDFRVLRFDLPGHGGSATGLLSSPQPGGTTVTELAELVLGLIDTVGRHRFHYAGVSLGGAIGAQLALGHPGRVGSLALVCSSAHFGPPEPWRERAALVRREGTGPLLATAPGRWFADPETTAATPLGEMLLRNLADADPAGYAACCDALADYDLRSALPRISAPALVIGGSHDVATPPHHARELAAGIPRATMKILGTGHLAVEEPRAVEALLGAHIAQVERPGR